MEYESKHDTEKDFLGFLGRKAKRLCEIYSLNKSEDEVAEEGNEKETYCTITKIEIIFKWKNPHTKEFLPDYIIHLSRNPDETKAWLPTKTSVEKTKYMLKVYDDKLYIGETGETLKEYLDEIGELREKNKPAKN